MISRLAEADARSGSHFKPKHAAMITASRSAPAQMTISARALQAKNHSPSVTAQSNKRRRLESTPLVAIKANNDEDDTSIGAEDDGTQVLGPAFASNAVPIDVHPSVAK